MMIKIGPLYMVCCWLLSVLLLVSSYNKHSRPHCLPVSTLRSTLAVLHGSNSNNDAVNSGEINYRFWTRRIPLTSTIVPSNTDHMDSSAMLDPLVDELQRLILEQGINVEKLEAGLILVNPLGLVVPIHDGMIQRQHMQYLPAVYTQTQAGDPIPIDMWAQFYGFSPRARHVVIAPSEEERPVDVDRLAAVNKALMALSITPEDLLGDEFAGTPPSRIYRSFVTPRPNAVYILEPVERAANRTAAQIELALRQVRADRASYLRNTDKSPLAVGTISLQSALPIKKLHPVALVLDNVRSAFNVGSMFRTAETAGAAELITCGITAHPPNPKLRKTAFTAVDVVPTRHFDDILQAVHTLKEEGYHIVAMETTSRSKEYSEVTYPQKVALVLGNEVTGVDTRVMEIADEIVEIPTYGIKNSLNVASAAPVVLFEVLRQWAATGKKAAP